ncbi:LysE family transporter, partial [Acinetobacter baumannii]
MLTNDALVALAGFALVSSATPGPNNLMLMSSGTHFGFLRTLPHLTGVTLGFVFLILCVGAGLIKLFEIVPGAHLALKIGSVSYLL